MLGEHHYQPELFSHIDIEALIPKNHLLRKIDRVLDLGFIRGLVAPLYSSDQGRPSVDPEVFMRMVLLEHLYNIDSDRRLCEEVGYNLAYRWFCRLSLRDKVPDHSAFTKIRDRLGEATFQGVFRKVIEQCKTAGLVKGERLVADGSFINANASIYTMEEKEKKETSKETEDNAKVKEPRGIGMEPSKDGLSNNDLRRHTIVGKKISNETHYSPTDPDATLAGKNTEYKSLRYKTHHIADADSRVILDCHVTTGTIAEVRAFPERLEYTRQSLELPIREVIADRGYGAGDIFGYLQDLCIDTNIPLWSTRVGQSFFQEKDFQFDPVKIEVRCPMGNLMKRNANDGAWHFSLPAETCRACPRFDTCLKRHEKKNRGKRVRIHDYQAIYQRVREQEKQPEFKKKLHERMWKMEGLFAEGKSHHGLRRARYRGRWKVQVQVYMISTVQNLKRLAAKAVLDFISTVREMMTNTDGRNIFEKFSLCRVQSV